MTKRKVLTVLDSSMLLSFVVLMSSRLSGIVAHEWIGFALIALILAHLLVHWGWVEATVVRAIRREQRGRVIPLLLNAALFVAMGTALVSGVVISKVVFPNTLLPGDYLQWHGLHESSATATIFVLGLHLALNWDRIRGAAQRLGKSSSATRRRVSYAWRMKPRILFRRAASIAVLSSVLVAGVWAKSRIFPSRPEIIAIFPDGHRERIAPPADIARIQPGSTAPDLSRGTARLALSLVMLGVAAVVGRYVLRLRLNAAINQAAAETFHSSTELPPVPRFARALSNRRQ